MEETGHGLHQVPYMGVPGACGRYVLFRLLYVERSRIKELGGRSNFFNNPNGRH